MTVAFVLIAIVLLTTATLLVSRLGGTEHQEGLNSPLHPREPTRDRPAGPEAEAMGVETAGEPSPREN